MGESPLERMYPNRCFDCLAVCPHWKVLCSRCEVVYTRARLLSPEGLEEEKT